MTTHEHLREIERALGITPAQGLTQGQRTGYIVKAIKLQRARAISSDSTLNALLDLLELQMRLPSPEGLKVSERIERAVGELNNLVNNPARALGKIKSPARAAASRANGKKGGRKPAQPQPQPIPQDNDQERIETDLTELGNPSRREVTK